MEKCMREYQIKRIGETRYNKSNSRMKIIKYLLDKENHILIRFDSGFEAITLYQSFKNGETKSPYDKTCCGIGYLGEGTYAPSNNHIYNKNYFSWANMLKRCYKSNKQFASYKNCRVDERWHNFQTFSDWYFENYYKIGNERMDLDKDILKKDNKIYSPDNCIFVPHSINVLFVKHSQTRGKYPIGVYLDKKKNRFRANCNVNGKEKRLGRFKTPEEAFYVYKEFKENLIKDTANYYRNIYPQFPIKLYNAMINYKVEITD